jgi:hypothetical protein
MLKKTIFITTIIIFTFSHFTTAQLGWQWADSFGGPESDFGISIAPDNSGNCYLIGTFQRNIQMGPYYMTGDSIHNHSFISKLDNSGNVVWATETGSVTKKALNDIATDYTNSFVITGTFTDTADFNGTSVISNGSGDAYIAKYDSSGNLTWIRSFGSMQYDGGNKICTDNEGNIYIAGLFDGSISINTNTISPVFGNREIFMTKFDCNGIFKWIKQISPTNWAYDLSGISTDSSGNLYVAGDFTSSVHSGSDSVTNAGYGFDLFLAKLDTNGNTLWLKKGSDMSHNYDISSASINTDNFGNIYVSGTFKDTIFFGNAVAIAINNQSETYLCKYDGYGNKIWIKSGDGPDGTNSISNDQFGNLYLTGLGWGNAVFGNVSVTCPNSSNGTPLLMKLDSSGNAIWGLVPLQCNLSSFVSKVRIKNSSLYMLGYYDISAQIGPFTMNANGIYDMALAKLGGIASGTGEINNDSDPLLYPNPSATIINILLTHTSELSVINLLGEKVLEYHFPIRESGKRQIDISVLPAGIYFIKADNKAQRFIKP